jgi:hypothetical protein
MTEEMRDFGDLEEKYANDPNWKIDDLYPCGVNFPVEFEDMLVDDSDVDEERPADVLAETLTAAQKTPVKVRRVKGKMPKEGPIKNDLR